MNRITVKKNEDYTTISNVFLRDKNLSLKAKGMLAVVMSLRSDWDFSINGICAILKEGKTSIYNTINELKENGYCQTTRCRDEKGVIIGNDYTFFENPNMGKQDEYNPHTENPNVDNQPQLNTDINKYLLNKENTSKRKVFVKPTVEEVRAYCLERGNNIDPEYFVDFYESKGWKINTTPMKDWKAAVRTWEKREKNSVKRENRNSVEDMELHVNDLWDNFKYEKD